jgi:hypothetical protein
MNKPRGRPFEPGNPFGRGRRKGSRNRPKCGDDLLDKYEPHHDQLYQGFYATIRRYFPTPGAWKPEYEQFVRILYAPTLSSEWPRLAMVRAIFQQMPYQSRVVTVFEGGPFGFAVTP